MTTLGLVLREQGDLDTARTRLERALAIRETGLGADHPDTVRSRQDLAAVAAALDKQQQPFTVWRNGRSSTGYGQLYQDPGGMAQRLPPAGLEHPGGTPPCCGLAGSLVVEQNDEWLGLAPIL